MKKKEIWDLGGQRGGGAFLPMSDMPLWPKILGGFK